MVFYFWNRCCVPCLCGCKWSYQIFWLAMFGFFGSCMLHPFLVSCMSCYMFLLGVACYMFRVGSNSGSSGFCFAFLPYKPPPFLGQHGWPVKGLFCLRSLCWQLHWIGVSRSTMLVLCGENTWGLTIKSKH